MKKYLIRFMGKNETVVAMSKVAAAAVDMYVREYKEVSKNDVLNLFCGSFVSDARRSRFLITKNEFDNLSNKNDKNRYSKDLPITLIDSNEKKVYYVTNQFADDGEQSSFAMFKKSLEKVNGFELLTYENNDEFKLISSVNKTTSTSLIPFHGSDADCRHVRYDKDVVQEERVSGLAEYLENAYECILVFLRKVIQNSIRADFMYGDFLRIPVLLRKQKPTGTTYQLSSMDKANMIKSQIGAYGTELGVDQINSILKLDYIHTVVDGEYIDFPEYITIYYNNITEDNMEKYYIAAARVLAHFVFRYYLSKIASKTNVDKKILEGSADYFSMLYLLSQYAKQERFNVDVAEKVFNNWRKYYGSPLPRAHAFSYQFVNGVCNPFYLTFEEYDKTGCVDNMIREIINNIL